MNENMGLISGAETEITEPRGKFKLVQSFHGPFHIEDVGGVRYVWLGDDCIDQYLLQTFKDATGKERHLFPDKTEITLVEVNKFSEMRALRGHIERRDIMGRTLPYLCSHGNHKPNALSHIYGLKHRRGEVMDVHLYVLAEPFPSPTQEAAPVSLVPKARR